MRGDGSLLLFSVFDVLSLGYKGQKMSVGV